MTVFIIVTILFSIFEIVSNFFHLSRRTLSGIADSGRKQHQELDLKLSDSHFVYKAIIMLCFGILFFMTSLMAIFNIGEIFLLIVLVIFSLYGFLQALFYRKNIKTWSAMIVYSVPLIT